jgi:cysteinyl-tRNA synthetase
VDDRIINRAVETKGEGETLEAACRRITDETIAWYHEDMDALGALRPNHEPRCTEYIPQMVTMTEKLIAKGNAYEKEGHVLFAVDSWKENYGKLSGRSVDDMIARSRVEVAPYKKNPMDFVLWKPSTPEQPGWESPWGRGRPGWHIECSAMAQALLGDVFDIHGGGIDLQFPHHENEVAQSCCANHTDVMANVWMHNGFLQVEGEKMAKSLGNFFTVKDLRDKGVPGEVMRFVLLSSHYREPLDWTQRAVDEAYKTLVRWGKIVGDTPLGDVPQDFVDALADDLNTARAIAVLHRLAKEGRAGELHSATKFLGLGLIFKVESSVTLIRRIEGSKDVELTAKVTKTANVTMKLSRAEGSKKTDWEEKIDELLSKRKLYRESRNFDKADYIRNALKGAGVIIEDTQKGPEWSVSSDYSPQKILEIEP